jgi:uncharacterized protein YdaU (DUF1376 family)
MKNPPSFQFYPQDFLSDINVQAMTMEERGIYITLLCHCWIEDGLPVETESRLVDNYFKKSDAVAQCFIEKDARYRNPRLDLERDKQRRWREKCSVGGSHSAEKKKLIKGSSTKGQVKGNSSSSSSSSIKKNPLTPLKGGERKPNNRQSRRLRVGASDPSYKRNAAYESARAAKLAELNVVGGDPDYIKEQLARWSAEWWEKSEGRKI